MNKVRDINREDLLKAITLINNSPELRKKRSSSTYDLVYNDNIYPPILVLSEANKLKGGGELLLSDFGNSVDVPFKILRNLGFEIRRKMGGLLELLKDFSLVYTEERKEKLDKKNRGFKIITNDIPVILRGFVSKNIYKVKGSVGQGVYTPYPWIGIFDGRVSSGATKGYYVVLLFSDNYKKFYLTLNQGSTVQTTEDKNKYENHVFTILTKLEGFIRGKLPDGSLVTELDNDFNVTKGLQYQETNLFYREYNILDFDENDFYKHLEILLNGYSRCVEYGFEKTKKHQIDFGLEKFISDLSKANLYFDSTTVTRFVSSLVTKPFVLLNGLSGSGKTKLAQAFVQWICQEESQYKIIPVGADWTNREPLLGYPDGLDANMYVTPDNGALQLMLDAQHNPKLPYFMILDEMNLSHVERYFADFLSIMESKDSIKLYTGKERGGTLETPIPQTLIWPKNLFIIGTVNIDETTYMFSPKVLDRANVIEFRLNAKELEKFFSLTDAVDLEALVCGGTTMSNAFLELAKSELKTNDDKVKSELVDFFKALSKVGAEFGYRTANEVLQLINQLGALDARMTVNNKVDIAVMQKLLPKLHGSRSKLVKVLVSLVTLCLDNSDNFDITQGENNINNIKYPISYAKLMRMYHNVIANGFTSYAEA